MIGTRLPDVRYDRPRGWPAWCRRDRCMRLVAEPGSYMKVTREDGSTWCWYVRAPNGDVCTIWPERHQITEHVDGKVSVSPSIVFPHGGRWHGFLRAGVWT